LLKGINVPIYGDGSQIRDWLYVDDHVEALWRVVLNGEVGETYNIGGHNEQKNIEIVNTICNVMQDLFPSSSKKFTDYIEFVSDRPGHDLRYAIDASKIKHDLQWVPNETFESGIKKTINWYIENEKWWSNL
jgi:dTDP-glucose 4,6-dehydratase